ncbi:AI-2E family transporter [Pollutimonas harenae]|uniref:AI-2E family transporter n=1 Tax=Pollutimonas harenae TaxID=657015 RepID=A0A853GY15_9BURK|nr:AI-2E family transporter [Pollutimonas harenae]NYT85636.1 AI-2E family transporter [Pollutimonas harenae]TEA70713.1 AI-2E family transporter [Pollutimonas harenae]
MKPAAVSTNTDEAEQNPDQPDPVPLSDIVPELSSRTSVGGLPLTILATIALVFTLQWAKGFFIPLVLGILIAFTLNPLVSWLERLRLPRIMATSLVMLALLGSSAMVAVSVYNEADAIMDELPTATYKLANAFKRINNGELGTLDKLRSAANTLKEAAIPAAPDSQTAGKMPAAPTVPSVPAINLNDWLWTGSLSAAAFLGQMSMVLLLSFFALLSGNTFKRKLVKLTGPSLSRKKITVQILDDINSSVQKYMLMLLVTNVLLGLISWAVWHLIGLENPGAWAVAGALLHIIPYFGSLLAAAATGFAAFMQFDSFSMMLLVAAIALGIASFVGMLVATWVTGRIAKMNPAAVFVALLFGTWLWGVWGMLLCVPIVMVIKVVSQHIEDLEPIAELLGD